MDGVRERHRRRPGDYSTDVVRTDAVEYLREAPADQPVFAMLTPFATHIGLDPARPVDPLEAVPARRHIDDPRWNGVEPLLTPAFDEADVPDKAHYIQAQPRVPYLGGWPLRRACEAMLSADQLLGAVGCASFGSRIATTTRSSSSPQTTACPGATIAGS